MRKQKQPKTHYILWAIVVCLIAIGAAMMISHHIAASAAPVRMSPQDQQVLEEMREIRCLLEQIRG